MFNSDQRSWMDYLAALPAEAKCDCGWSRRGECFGPRCYGKADRGGFVPKDEIVETVECRWVAQSEGGSPP